MAKLASINALRSWAWLDPDKGVDSCGGCTGMESCSHKTNKICNVCGFPIFNDESWQRDSRETAHYRCKNEVVPRPEHMVVKPCIGG